jgi:HK97 family phage major capsid protein
MPVTISELKSLREQRAKLVADADAILTAAPEGEAGGTRDLTSEDEAKFESIHEDADKLRVQIQRLERQFDAERAINDRPDLTAEDKAAAGDALKRQLDEQPKGSTAEVDEAAQEEAFTRAYEEYLVTGDTAAMDNFERDLMTTTEAKGGYVVPHKVYDQIILPMREIEAVRRAGATVITEDESGPYTVPVILDTHDGEQRDEGTSDADVDPVFGSANLQDYRFDSDAVPVTNQMLMGRRNLEQLLYRILRQRIARKMQQRFTTGNGTSGPEGVVTGATPALTAASETAVTYGELVSLIFSLPEQYRSAKNFAVMLNGNSLAAVRKLVGTDGHPIVGVSIVPGQADTILGRRVIENSDMPSMFGGSPPIVAGDFSQYYIKDVKSTRIIRDPYSRANKDEVVFHGFHNAGGAVADPAAFRKLTMGGA